jgi:hypothetical protein
MLILFLTLASLLTVILGEYMDLNQWYKAEFPLIIHMWKC